MCDERGNISAKSFSRSLDPIIKMGYMDGASNGQNATFQSSFNIGYKQGLSFGLNLGFNQANPRIQDQPFHLQELKDPKKINCQICLKNATTQENIVNLCNIQKEKNDEIMSYFRDVESNG
ncbi:uncharacterized protein LOC131847779 [Achroia grisella]|uniref:uncharacterized protein LOC131847779 n=1 Tax=Achroia grisella TaxID=688607 RepID=UPI0027D2ABF4|nr:uncharacterized protein LOC131847779 [Achroia grisella]XP_059053411.1 uncharacterized protein LOC131847779 [Achroia grisella]